MFFVIISSILSSVRFVLLLKECFEAFTGHFFWTRQKIILQTLDFSTLIFDFFPIFQDISLEQLFVNIILIAKDVIYICLS